MKNVNVAIAVFLIASLTLVAFASAVQINDVLGADSAVSGAVDVTTSISASDAVEAEIEVENELKFDSSAKQTVSKGQGWIVTGQKGGLLEILFVTKEGKTSDGNMDSISKGWLRTGNLKLKLESIASTDTSKTFAVTAGDGSVSGTLELTKTSQSYQEGFAVWNGDLELKVGGEPFSAKVTVAIEEKQSEKGSSGKGSGNVAKSTSGTMELGNSSYTLEGFSKNKKIELKIKSSNGAIGELKLESKDSINYVGKIEIENDSDDNEIEGRATATLKLDGNTLYGPIVVEINEDLNLEGNIKLVISGGFVSDDSDKSDSSEDSDNSGSSNRGFWKKFFDFFGN